MKRYAPRILLAAIAACVTIGFVEVALRTFFPIWPELYQPDIVTGRSHRPNMALRYTIEGDAWVEINAAGYRDIEHSVTKKDGIYRIAFVGDSMTEALQVDLEETFWSLLPERLSAACAVDPATVEILNFGMSGFGTSEELLTIRHKVWTYEPNLVVTMFFENDVVDNVEALNGYEGRPYFIMDQNGNLILDDTYREYVATQMRERNNFVMRFARGWLSGISSLFARAGYIFDQNARTTYQRQVGFGEVPAFGTKKVSDVAEIPISSSIAVVPVTEMVTATAPPIHDSVVESAWQLTEALLSTMADEVKQHDVSFLLAIASAPYQVLPDVAERQKLSPEHPFYASDRLGQISRERGIDVLDLARPLATFAENMGEYLHGFENTRKGYGHWNQVGHAAVANLLAEHLCARGLFGNPQTDTVSAVQ